MRISRQRAAIGAAAANPNLTFTLLAHQLHEMSGPVDQEEVTGVVEIFPFKVFCPEP